MKWLITAFEPFGGASSNSSAIVLEHLKSTFASDTRFDFLFHVPVTFAEAWLFVEAQIKKQNYKGVLALGQAETRQSISLEQVALNVVDARIADNSGKKLGPHKWREGGPDVFWSTIPWTRLEDSKSWSRSYSAGAFVCNALMYDLLNWATQHNKLAGFVHVPLVQSQTDTCFDGMFKAKDDEIGRALERILNFLVQL